jgi:thymidylate synthase
MNKTIAIATGWTPVAKVAKHIPADSYYVMKQLYSCTPGINILIRNLLANPNIRYLLLLNCSEFDKNAGSVECLLDFFTFGFTAGKTNTGRDAWVIKSNRFGYIDIEIPEEVLNRVRNNVHAYAFEDIYRLKNFVDAVFKIELNPWSNPMTFPEQKATTIICPGELNGHRIEANYIHQAWVKILHRIRNTGKISISSSGIYWQEILNLMTIITDEPEELIFPEPNYLPTNKEFVNKYVQQILCIGDNSNSYGTRINEYFGVNQTENVINMLKTSQISNRLVINLWDATTDIFSQSPPCLNHIWIKIYNNELCMTATLRSNDMFSAWVSNAMGLRSLQYYIFNKLSSTYPNLDIGALTVISQSAHIYEDCWNAADDIVLSHYQSLYDKKAFRDAVGNFVIQIDDGIIVVTQFTKCGEEVKKYSGKSSSKLCDKILADNPSILAEHAAYLGIELHKAEVALASGAVYCQF